MEYTCLRNCDATQHHSYERAFRVTSKRAIADATHVALVASQHSLDLGMSVLSIAEVVS